jgi:hypothetical protein
MSKIAAKISEINLCDTTRVFTLKEARALMPLVTRITRESYDELEPVRARLEAMLPTHPDINLVEAAYESVVTQWVGKMERLGLIVKGIWLVDFDTGDGYFCWKFPELKLGHFHGYSEGFANRRPIDQVVEELDPDWARN